MQIAIITAISVIVAALITAIATGWQRKREAPERDVSQDLISELTRRAVTAEARVIELEQAEDSLSERVDELEAMLWRNGVDPRTGELVSHERPGAGES